MTDLETLKLNLQESRYPCFTDAELLNLLTVCNDSVAKASWRGCLLKANGEKKIVVGGIEVQNFEPDYWLNLADVYKKDYELEVYAAKTTLSRFKQTMARLY